MKFPDHWMKDFFLAGASLELMRTNDALAYYDHLSSVGFSGSTYINNQLAMVHYQLKGINNYIDIIMIDLLCRFSSVSYSL